MRLGVALLLWLSTMVLVLANNAIGNTIIAGASVQAANIYNAVIPLPYVALCAWVLARRSPQAGLADGIAIGALWSISTIVADVLVGHLLQGLSWRLASVHYRFWEGYLFALVPLLQLAAPGAALELRRRFDRKPMA